MLTISSVILPAVVASAYSSKGFIFAKNSSTLATLLVSAPKSNNVAPSETKPSGILNRPDPIPASAERKALGLLFSAASGVRSFCSKSASVSDAICYSLYVVYINLFYVISFFKVNSFSLI